MSHAAGTHLLGVAWLALAAGLHPGPAGAAPAYMIGPGDVLEVVVAGRPELSAAPTVQPDGEVELPLLGGVAAAGLSEAEAGAKLTRLYAEPIAAAPPVRVRVIEFNSRFASVEGAVNRPGRCPLRYGARLVDVLADSGGFSASASGEVVVIRLGTPFADGGRSLRVRVYGGELTPADRVNLELPLRHGDRVVALRVERVAVLGMVRRPGLYELRDAPTLLAALATAGGTLERAEEAALKRAAGSGSGTVDLEAARRGELADPALRDGDVVTVR